MGAGPENLTYQKEVFIIPINFFLIPPSRGGGIKKKSLNNFQHFEDISTGVLGVWKGAPVGGSLYPPILVYLIVYLGNCINFSIHLIVIIILFQILSAALPICYNSFLRTSTTTFVCNFTVKDVPGYFFCFQKSSTPFSKFQPAALPLFFREIEI